VRRDDLRRLLENIGRQRRLRRLAFFPGGRLSQHTSTTNPFRRGYLPGKTLGRNMTDKVAVDQQLDITAEVCPMTFVRTRLALDRMAPGQILLVRLRGEEPLRNVPRTAREQGHEVLSLDTGADGVATLLLRRGR
jgi:tRNA 2-thiouridine synthesizing protein A